MDAPLDAVPMDVDVRRIGGAGCSRVSIWGMGGICGSALGGSLADLLIGLVGKLIGILSAILRSLLRPKRSYAAPVSE